MIVDTLNLSADQFEAGTGWAIEARGACKGDVCVPLGSPEASGFDAVAVAEQLGMPIVEDTAYGLWALGPASLGGKALTTAVAPELVLPDIDGREFRLSSLLGQKVVLVAWAPY
jgi:hypothetical protein